MRAVLWWHSGVTGFTQFDEKEQTDDGTTYRFRCPPGCVSIAVAAGEVPPFNTNVFGSDIYADLSYICAAAAHAGLLTDAGGLVQVRVEEGLGPYASNKTGTNFGCVGLAACQASCRHGTIPECLCVRLSARICVCPRTR